MSCAMDDAVAAPACVAEPPEPASWAPSVADSDDAEADTSMEANTVDLVGQHRTVQLRLYTSCLGVVSTKYKNDRQTDRQTRAQLTMLHAQPLVYVHTLASVRHRLI